MSTIKIRPEVQAIINQYAAIDWTNPPRDVERVTAAYQRRLCATGLTRTVRWIADPADFSDWNNKSEWDHSLDARDARAAWNASASRNAWDTRYSWGDTMDARNARNVRDVWRNTMAASASWASWAAWNEMRASAACDTRCASAVRDASDAVEWLNIEPSVETSDWLPVLIDTYTHMIDAYEGGAFAHILLENEILVLAAPSTHIDGDGRLHRGNGPAMKWRDTAVYAWHGTIAPRLRFSDTPE